MPGPFDLNDVVATYTPSGDEPSHQAALGLLAEPGSGWRRSEFHPGHFTASGFVVSPDGSALLVVHHARLGRWLQPGGHIEAVDDSVEIAARREVAEETGVVDLVRLGHTLVRIDAHPIPDRNDEPAHIHFDLAMAFRARSWDIGPIDEVLDARWVRFEDLETYDVDDAFLAGARMSRVGMLSEPQ